MARLYSNENFPLAVVVELRRLGHDVETIQETGLDNQGFSDEEVLAYATREMRAVVTLNRRDFIRLHRDDPEHQGIIVCTVDSDRARQAQRIHDAIVGEGDLAGILLRVNRPSS